MDIYKNWDVFISNMEIVPQQLDGEKLAILASGLSRSREERELLGKEAAAGEKASLEKLINSYVPMIVAVLKKYAPRIGYNRDVFMNCVEKTREKVVNSIYYDNFDYDVSRYVSWMARNEVTHYIATQDSILIDSSVGKEKVDLEAMSLQEMLEKIISVLSDEEQAELSKNLLGLCKNEREQKLIGFRFGLYDGTPKTLQETADLLGISKERARQIETVVARRIAGHIRRNSPLGD